jgi:hypothetical protein
MAFVGRAAGCFAGVFGLAAPGVGAKAALILNLGRFSTAYNGEPNTCYASQSAREDALKHANVMNLLAAGETLD